MKYNELMKVEPGTVLLVNGWRFNVDQVSHYKCRTASWLDLIFKMEAGEVVLELSDGKIRLWKQVSDLSEVSRPTKVSPARKSVACRGHHFEVVESSVKAETVTRNVAGEIKEDSVTSVYVDKGDEDVLLSIETKKVIPYVLMARPGVGERLFVWYSDKTISPRDIKVSR